MKDGLNLFLFGKKLATRETTLGWLRDIELWVLQETQAFNDTDDCSIARYISNVSMLHKKPNSRRECSGEYFWLERCHIASEACLIITYAYAMKYSYEQAIRESSVVAGISIKFY